jgi:hypothetical protein
VGHDHDPLGLAVEHQSEIQLALDRHGGLDVQPMDDPTLRPGLMGDQPLAQQILGRLPDFILTGAELDATGLAPGSGVNLSLDGPARAADFRGAVHRLLRAVGDPAARNGDAESGEQLLGLIFVDVHSRSGKRKSISSRSRVASYGSRVVP